MTDQRSTLDIINDALDAVEVGRVGSEEELKTKTGRSALAQVNKAIGYVLALKNWACCREARTDTPTEPSNDPDWAYEITLPADALTVWRLGPKETPYPFGRGIDQEANRLRIFCHVPGPVAMVWGRRVRPALMDDHVFDLCSVYLATKIAGAAGLSANRKNELKIDFRNATRQAALVEASMRGARAAYPRGTAMDAMDGGAAPYWMRGRG